MFYDEEFVRKEFCLIPLMKLANCIAGGKVTGRRRQILEIYMYEEDVAKALDVTRINTKNYNIDYNWESRIIARQINDTASMHSSVCGIIIGVTPEGKIFQSGSDRI